MSDIIKVNSPFYEEFAVTVDDGNDEYKVNNYLWTSVAPTTTCVPANCCTASTTTVPFAACDITKLQNVDTTLECLGRLLKVKVTLKCGCPNKKVAVGVLVFDGAVCKGFKFKVVDTDTPTPQPILCGDSCGDICICEFCFVLDGSNICSTKNFDVKVIAHYTDITIPTCG